MTLYLVRHGESEGNFYHRHQSDAEVLTQKGHSQAQKVAKRFASIHVDKIVASPTERTRQTAEEIVAQTHAPIEFDPRFRELQGPSQIQGLAHSDPTAKKVKQKIADHKFDQAFHYSDEDNYFDFIKRVSEGLYALESYGDEETVVVVAHGHVLRAIIGLLLFGVEFSPQNFDQLIERIQTTNTGISIATHTPERGWQLLTFNDHAHLLE